MRRWIAAGAAVLALAVVGCGQDDDTSAEPETTQATEEPATPSTAAATPEGLPGGCEPVPAALRRELAASLKGDRTLRQVYAVQSEDEFGPYPRGIAEGAWFVTGDVRPDPGLSTWIVSDDGGQPWSPASTGGSGIIIGADPAARAVSDLGVDVDLAEIGVSESSDGYAESVARFD